MIQSKTVEEILEMNLLELRMQPQGFVLVHIANKERVFDDESMFNKPPFNPKNADGIHAMMQEVIHDFEHEEEIISKVTARQVLEGWSLNHLKIIGQLDRHMATFDKMCMRELFDKLIEVGLSKQLLEQLPSSAVIFAQRTMGEILDATPMDERMDERAGDFGDMVLDPRINLN